MKFKIVLVIEIFCVLIEVFWKLVILILYFGLKMIVIRMFYKVVVKEEILKIVIVLFLRFVNFFGLILLIVWIICFKIKIGIVICISCKKIFLIIFK